MRPMDHSVDKEVVADLTETDLSISAIARRRGISGQKVRKIGAMFGVDIDERRDRLGHVNQFSQAQIDERNAKIGADLLSLEHMTLVEIGERHGVSSTTVYHVAKRLGIDTKARKRIKQTASSNRATGEIPGNRRSTYWLTQPFTARQSA
ncbi:hypothetical protein [Marinobacterium litorale]|uniref:hypothetical protein n=1 Tax=Marinobacterium litorale TaxID=404770 RepID=UPI000483164B|nr:hypothetical protein [Marinobacterium litorale]